MLTFHGTVQTLNKKERTNKNNSEQKVTKRKRKNNTGNIRYGQLNEIRRRYSVITFDPHCCSYLMSR